MHLIFNNILYLVIRDNHICVNKVISFFVFNIVELIKN